MKGAVGVAAGRVGKRRLRGTNECGSSFLEAGLFAHSPTAPVTTGPCDGGLWEGRACSPLQNNRKWTGSGGRSQGRPSFPPLFHGGRR